MANIKISELTPKGANLASTDLLEISESAGGGTYVTKSITGAQIVAAAGGVTSVSGTAPIASTGGTTPTISIATANTSTTGALTSTDWNTFNGKQNALTLTTTGTSGAATLVGSTLNIPQYSGGGGASGVHILTPPESGRRYNLNINQQGNTTVGGLGVSNTLYFLPFIPRNSITISNIQINVGTGAAGSTACIGIYTDSNGTPATLIAQSAILDCSTTGVKTFTTTQTFVAGTTYWFAAQASTQVTLTFTQHSATTLLPLACLNNNNMFFSRSAGGYTIGSLPASLLPNNTTLSSVGGIVFYLTAL